MHTAGTTAVLPRRGLNRVEAAIYVGVGTSKFDEMVRDGRMPKPLRIDARAVWDIRKLDAAFEALDPADGGPGTDTEESDDWKEVA